MMTKRARLKKTKVTDNKKSYWIAYHEFDGAESCNVFYSDIVYARSEIEARMIFALDNEIKLEETGAAQKTVHNIDTMNKYFLQD